MYLWILKLKAIENACNKYSARKAVGADGWSARELYSLPPAPCGRKNVYCQDVVKVEAFDEEPVEHRCPRILD